MMKYKIGDKVKVRGDLEVNAVRGYVYYVTGMIDYKEVTIIDIGIQFFDDVEVLFYIVKENNYFYTDEMIDGLVIEDSTDFQFVYNDNKIVGYNNLSEDFKFSYNGYRYYVNNEFRLDGFHSMYTIPKDWKQCTEKHVLEMLKCKYQLLIYLDNKNTLTDTEILELVYN